MAKLNNNDEMSNCDIIWESKGKGKCPACLSPEIMLCFKEIFSQNYVT